MAIMEDVILQQRLAQVQSERPLELFSYSMYAGQVNALHQVIALAIGHTDFQDCDQAVLRDLGEWCVVQLIRMGLTPDEAQMVHEMRGE